jgi:Glycosyl hydrolases family 2, TIM barrel domain
MNMVNNRSFKSWSFRIGIAVVMLVILIISFFYFNKGPQNLNSFQGSRKVIIQKENGRYAFNKDGKSFIVKGGAGFTQIKELVSCGGNTIIIWDTSKLAATLDEAAQYNISVIVGIDIPDGENRSFYDDEKKVVALCDAYSKTVFRYKDHPSILAWSLGNELSMPFTLTTSSFYKTYNRLLSLLHTNDPHHPVTTVINHLSSVFNIQWRIPALDFISVNLYNRMKTIQPDFDEIKLIWNGPYLVSEWAPNGVWEAPVTSWGAPIENTSTKKAGLYQDFFKRYMPVNDPRFLGSLVFYWGSRHETTPTWYSIFNEDGVPTEIMEVMYDGWRDTITKHQAPKIKRLQLDNIDTDNNIFFTAGSEHKANLLLETSKPADSLNYSWQILKEDWLSWMETWHNFKRPPAETGLLTDSTLQHPGFVVPLQEGPYRIFVTVYNANGYCATANIPFYVVK